MSNFNFGANFPQAQQTPVAQTPVAPQASPAFAPPQAFAPQAAPFAGMPAAAPQAAPVAVGGDVFAGLNGAQTYASGQYFDCAAEGPGTYVVRINDSILKNTFKNGPSVIFELEVVQSTNPNMPPGTKRGDTNPLNKRQYTGPNLIAFLGAVYGFDKNNAEHLQIINGQISQQLEAMLKAATQQKVLNGALVMVTTAPHTTKEGKKITKKIYSPVQGATPGQITKG